MNAVSFKNSGYYRHALAVEQAESPKELLARAKKDDPEMRTKQVQELNRAWESILHNSKGIVEFGYNRRRVVHSKEMSARMFALTSAAPLSDDAIRLHGAMFELDEEASQKFYDSEQVQEFLEICAEPISTVDLIDFHQKIIDLAKFILEIDAGS